MIQCWRTQYEANQLVDRPSSRERALEAENERLKVDPKLKAERDADLRHRIERIHAEFPGYGYRVYEELVHQGEIVNTKRLRHVTKQFRI